MTTTVWPWLACWRAWCSRWRPHKRRAMAKRRLEVILREEGLSRSQALRVIRRYWEGMTHE